MCFPSKGLLWCSSTRPSTTMRCSPGMASLRKSMRKLWKRAYPTPSSMWLRNSPGAAHADWSPSSDIPADTPPQPSGAHTLTSGLRCKTTATLTRTRPHRSAFCCWLLGNVLLSMPVVLYAGYMMLATAAFIFFSAASFSTAMNAPQCVFYIGDDSFQTWFSHSFWLALATGKTLPGPLHKPSCKNTSYQHVNVFLQQRK